jgi:hypothetical protein
MPKIITPASPASTASTAAFRSVSSVCCTTPGIELIGRGSLIPSATNTGKINCRAARLVSATIARITGVVRNRRGRDVIIGRGPFVV